MPEGYGYPKGKDILGKINQGELGPDVAKRPNDKPGKKEKVDASIFNIAEQRDY